MTDNVLIIIGTALLAYSLAMPVLTKINYGIILTGIAGAVCLLYGLFFETLSRFLWFDILFFAGFAAVLMISAVITVFSFNDNDTGGEDAVIVLGCGLRGEKIGRQLGSRLETAAAYGRKNKNAVIIVSGGQGRGETITEAEAMARRLAALGIPENRIVREDKSVSTTTNIVFSKKILDLMFDGKEYKTLIVTSGYHVFRAVKTAERHGLVCTHLHSHVPAWQIPFSYARECASIVKFLLHL